MREYRIHDWMKGNESVSEFLYFGSVALTEGEVDLLDQAVLDTRKQNITCGIYALLEERARRNPDYPEFVQYQVDAFLEARGLKSPDFHVPPRMLATGYILTERYIRRGEILPQWWERGDGAILYYHRWWSTDSSPEGNRMYAWFQVKDVLGSTQVSPWKPFEHYLNKRRYWRGEVIQGSCGPYRPLYSTIIERGEIDLG